MRATKVSARAAARGAQGRRAAAAAGGRRGARVARRAAPEEPTEPAAAPTEPIAPAPTPAISFGDVMGFSGLAPERVNGRLAMLGFVAAAGAELSTNEPLQQQISEATGPIAGAFLLFIAASLIPLAKGAKLEAFGPFTPKAEMLNGRAAMLGFLLLIGFEAGSGSALF